MYFPGRGSMSLVLSRGLTPDVLRRSRFDVGRPPPEALQPGPQPKHQSRLQPKPQPKSQRKPQPKPAACQTLRTSSVRIFLNFVTSLAGTPGPLMYFSGRGSM